MGKRFHFGQSDGMHGPVMGRGALTQSHEHQSTRLKQGRHLPEGPLPVVRRDVLPYCRQQDQVEGKPKLVNAR